MSEITCGCSWRFCQIRVEITKRDEEELKKHPDWVVVSDTCSHGPETDDILVKVCSGYKIYQIKTG